MYVSPCLLTIVNSIFLESALIDIRTPGRPDIDHWCCALEGNMRDLKNSIFPESALIDIRTPERPDIDHQCCVLAGKMRN